MSLWVLTLLLAASASISTLLAIHAERKAQREIQYLRTLIGCRERPYE